MTSVEKKKIRAVFTNAAPLRNGELTPFDPEMVYVECGRCGSPLIWGPGKTTELIVQYGLNPNFLDAGYLILTDGCNNCSPDEDGYLTRIVRLSEAPGFKDKSGGN